MKRSAPCPLTQRFVRPDASAACPNWRAGIPNLKSSGVLSVDGVLYWAVSCFNYGDDGVLYVSNLLDVNDDRGFAPYICMRCPALLRCETAGPSKTVLQRFLCCRVGRVWLLLLCLWLASQQPPAVWACLDRNVPRLRANIQRDCLPYGLLPWPPGRATFYPVRQRLCWCA